MMIPDLATSFPLNIKSWAFDIRRRTSKHLTMPRGYGIIEAVRGKSGQSHNGPPKPAL